MVTRLFGSWILLCVGALTACTPPPRAERATHPLPPDPDLSAQTPGKTGSLFVQTDPGEPTTLNWLVSEDATSSAMIGLLFDGLINHNECTDEVQPGLAKSWEVSPDNQTFTFHLRPGLQWSDGRPLDADDVLFTFTCIYDPRFPNRHAYDYSVEGKPFEVTKMDRLTVQIRTPEIFAPFLLYMSGLSIMPRHALEPSAKDGTLQKRWNIGTAQKHPEQIVTSSAYRIQSYRPGERIVLQPNPYYWRMDRAGTRLPYIDFMLFRFVKDQNASIVAFASGQTDVEGITPGNVAWVKKSEKLHDFTIHDRGPSTASNFLWFNQNPGHNKDGQPFVDPLKIKWFQDQRFRQAISCGIDRQGIVDGVLFGRGAPLWGPESPANVKWFNPNVRQYPYDAARARQLLTEAGFVFHEAAHQLQDRTGHPVTFTLLTNQENPIRTDMATVFKENMQELGITVDLQFVDFGTLVGKISNSFDYEACLLGLTGGGDPSGGTSVYSSKGRLHQWYPNQPTPATPWEARIDELMAAQLKTLNETARKKYYDEVQMIMSEQVPYIYLITPNAYAGLKNKWQNVQIPRTGSLIWNLDQIWAP